MPPDADGYDFFVSYAREDNRGGWISGFVEDACWPSTSGSRAGGRR